MYISSGLKGGKTPKVGLVLDIRHTLSGVSQVYLPELPVVCRSCSLYHKSPKCFWRAIKIALSEGSRWRRDEDVPGVREGGPVASFGRGFVLVAGRTAGPGARRPRGPHWPRSEGWLPAPESSNQPDLQARSSVEWHVTGLLRYRYSECHCRVPHPSVDLKCDAIRYNSDHLRCRARLFMPSTMWYDTIYCDCNNNTVHSNCNTMTMRWSNSSR